jgi:hypothetical protein
VLLHLDDERPVQLLVDDQGVMDARQVAGRKLDVDDDAGYTYDCSSSFHAGAPPGSYL